MRALRRARRLPHATWALRRSDPNPPLPPFTGGTNPGEWRPTAPAFAPMGFEQQAYFIPFALTGPARFRAPPPPALTSSKYTADYNEVKDKGALTGSTRTAGRDGHRQLLDLIIPGTSGTGGYAQSLNSGCRTPATARGSSRSPACRSASAITTAWDSKRYYNLWRPITAIQEGDNDTNDATVGDPDWQPFIITPPYPDYTSGANSVCGADHEVARSCSSAGTTSRSRSRALRRPPSRRCGRTRASRRHPKRSSTCASFREFISASRTSRRARLRARSRHTHSTITCGRSNEPFCDDHGPASKDAGPFLFRGDNGRMKVRILPANREFDARPDEPVLTAALRQHLNLPHSCKGGSCGTCRVRVLSRRALTYPHGRPAGIDAAEAAAGYALICQARAREDLVIETREIRHVTDVEIRELPARVERMQRLAPDVMGLWLRLPAIEPFTWQARPVRGRHAAGRAAPQLLARESAARRGPARAARAPRAGRRLQRTGVRRHEGGQPAADRGSARPVRLPPGRPAAARDRRRHGLRAAQGDPARSAGNRVAARGHAVLGRAHDRRPVRRRAGCASWPRSTRASTTRA